jgi:hypothetical protein
VKPANKAERSAAELVEQRAGTKGNADQQSTRRAQERESVSQALGRIRQAAKQRKKEKFTALFHQISVGLLRLAFFEMSRQGLGKSQLQQPRILETRLHSPHAAKALQSSIKF